MSHKLPRKPIKLVVNQKEQALYPIVDPFWKVALKAVLYLLKIFVIGVDKK